MAAKGLLICILSGPKPAVARLHPYLQGVCVSEPLADTACDTDERERRIATTVVDMSDEIPGNALQIKLIGNTLILAAVNSIAEALAFADKTGVGVPHMASLIAALFPRPPHALYLQRMTSGEYYSGTVCLPVRASANTHPDLATRR